jgi:hypothetical protein
MLMDYGLIALVVVLLEAAGALAIWVNYLRYKRAKERNGYKGLTVNSRRARLAKMTETVFMEHKRVEARVTDLRRAELAKWRVQDELSISSVRAFENALSSATGERPMQKVLEKHPEILACLINGHNGAYVIPQSRLGNQHVPDFLIAAETSLGLLWSLIELKSPTAPLTIGDGQHSKELRRAIKQIIDWREWLNDNSDYARRNTSENGLGLHGIRSDAHAFIIISRADMPRASDRLRIRELNDRIEIHTYDWLIRNCRMQFRPEELDAARQNSLLDITIPTGTAATKLIIQRLHQAGALADEPSSGLGTATDDD